MQSFLISPRAMASSLWRHRSLITALVKREVVGRYRGSVMGILWSFFNPLLMLVIYTFVFSVVFKSRWGTGPEDSKLNFAVILFVGMIVHGLFAECVTRAPGLILSNVNYVKKVIFPLEVLPWVAFGSALFHSLISLVVLLLVQLFLVHQLPWTAIFFPIVLLPLMFLTMGFSWFLASVGVYVRDISQITGMFTSILFFLSPIVYPVSSLPVQYQAWMQLNPLAFVIEQGRNTLILGVLPDVGQWCVMMVAGLMFAMGGFAWFQKTRKGFADVL
jgi:lipopolysaccharide transport system permease protein